MPRTVPATGFGALNAFATVPRPKGTTTTITMTTSSPLAEPGWYPDYTSPALLRWFDGDSWTHHVAVRPHSRSSPVSPPAPRADAVSFETYRHYSRATKLSSSLTTLRVWACSWGLGLTALTILAVTRSRDVALTCIAAVIVACSNRRR